MKKRLIVTVFGMMLLVLLGIYSCKKESTPQPPPSFTDRLAEDGDFTNLNDAINRFDPMYLKLVYHDGRTTTEISNTSLELMKRIGQDPNNELLLNEFATFYHFKSVEELKENSGKITVSFQELNRKFNLTDEVLNRNKADDFGNARIRYAERKYKEFSTNNPIQQPRSFSTNNVRKNNWEDYTAMLDDYFHFLMTNQTLTTDADGGGGEDCGGEICCAQRLLCFNDARREFTNNFVKLGASGLASGGAGGITGGGLVGNLLGPGVGTVMGSTIGGFIGAVSGGAFGTAIAYILYNIA